MRRQSAKPAALAVFLCLSSGQVLASSSFPVASCAGWSGTAVEQDGIDTPSATMTGMVTKADLQEYCERDPGGETKQTVVSLPSPSALQSIRRRRDAPF
jgi:hypothetical protein